MENDNNIETRNYKLKYTQLDGDKNGVSDWEDCGLTPESENVINEINENIFPNNKTKVEEENELSELDKYEFVPSDEESKIDNIEDGLDQTNCANATTYTIEIVKKPTCERVILTPCYVFGQFINLFLLIISFFEFIGTVFHLILVAFKDCIVNLLSKLCPCRITQKWKNRNKYKLIGNNSNNNALDDDCEIQNYTVLCIYMLASVGSIGLFLSYCWVNPESQICSIHLVIRQIKLKLQELWSDLYMLPGDDCMHANRCCKGPLEAFFRWVTCLLTIQIRCALTAWPHSQEQEVQPESLENIKIMVERILADLGDIKDRVNKMEELLLKLRTNYGELEKLVREKSEDIVYLDPLAAKYGKKLKQMQHEILAHKGQIQNVLAVKTEADKIIENMKSTAREATAQIKSSISALKSFIETEAHRLDSQLEILEALIKEDEHRVRESNERHIVRVRSELDHIRLVEDDIRNRLTTLSDLPAKYKKMSDQMKEDIKTKLDNDLILHDNLSKKTECFCMKKLDDFKKKLAEAKSYFNCFLEKRVNERMTRVEKEIKAEVSRNFYESTVEIAKATAEQAMINNVKSHTQLENEKKQHAKAAGTSGIVSSVPDAPQQSRCDAFTIDTACYLKASMNSTSPDEIAEETNTEETQCLSKQQIRNMIKMAFVRYSADKIGLADFALESMGGSVIPELSSPTYIPIKAGTRSFFSIFSSISGSTDNSQYSLRSIIQPNTQPGECWPFAGSQGVAVVNLAQSIIVKAVSIDHLPASMSPSGTISSAPRQFTVSTMDSEEDKEILMGKFEYIEGSTAVQTFWFENPAPGRKIKLSILNNHGNQEYTCIYRLRVHGSLLSNPAG